MPLQTTITNLQNKDVICAWIPPHGRKLPALGTITIPGDIYNYHMFPTPNWRMINAIASASMGENKIVDIDTTNV